MEIDYYIKFYNNYSQCSYNCYAMILDYFYGTPNTLPIDDDFKNALPKRLRGFYGWSPFFRFIIKEGNLNWDNNNIRELNVESFSINKGEKYIIENSKVLIKITEIEIKIIKKCIDKDKRILNFEFF